MVDLTNEQRIKLDKYFDKMCDLSDEIRKVCARAEALGDIDEDEQWGRFTFNMARAGDAILKAFGELKEEPKLMIDMHDPDEIIARCELLISASEEYVDEIKFKMSREK